MRAANLSGNHVSKQYTQVLYVNKRKAVRVRMHPNVAAQVQKDLRCAGHAD